MVVGGLSMFRTWPRRHRARDLDGRLCRRSRHGRWPDEAVLTAQAPGANRFQITKDGEVVDG